MKVAIIGIGHVGLPMGVGLAELGNQVICIDRDSSKIEALSTGKITLFEEGLEEQFQKNLKAGRIKFTTSMKEGVERADLIIIAVGAPLHPVTKEVDLKYIHAAATELADYLTGYTVIATHYVVPVGTGDDIKTLISQKNPKADFDVVSLPEDSLEGFIESDACYPGCIVVGADSKRAKNLISELYKPFEGKTKMLFVKRRNSETIKYVSKGFFAIKAHYINEIANFCEKSGVDAYEVALGVGADSRIGSDFLSPGPGYGGSWFPEDSNIMAFRSPRNGVGELSLVEIAVKGNKQRKKQMAKRILDSVAGLESPKISILGLAFKEGTDDCRESVAMEILGEILAVPGLKVTVYDPKAMDNARKLMGNKVNYAKDAYQSAKGADVLVILTAWNEFRNLDLTKMANLMNYKCIVDLRNTFSPEDAAAAGFEYYTVGKQMF